MTDSLHDSSSSSSFAGMERLRNTTESKGKEPMGAGTITGEYQGHEVLREDANDNCLFHIFRSLFGSSHENEVVAPPPSHSTPVDETNYLDSNRLMKGNPADQKINPEHRDWFLNLALILGHAQNADPATRDKLLLAALHGYSKAATVGASQAENLGIQTSPFFADDNRYHRSSNNSLLEAVRAALSQDTGLPYHEVRDVDSSFFREVITRNLPQPQLSPGSLDINSMEKFDALVDQLLDNAIKGDFPENRVVIDMSKLIAGMPAGGAREMAKTLEMAFLKKLDEKLNNHPEISVDDISNKLVGKLHLIGFTKHKGNDILLIPTFLLDPKPEYSKVCNQVLGNKNISGKHGGFDRALNHMLIGSGYRISPDHAKKMLLSLKDFRSLLTEQHLPESQLATHGTVFPKVLDSCNHFSQLKIVNQFKALSTPDAPPYLQVMSVATARLVEALAHLHPEQGGLDKVFEDHGLKNMLQVSYFRIMNAMHEAVEQKNNPIAFHNQIEMIHQEIENILAADPLPPYADNTLATSVARTLTTAPNPIVPENLGRHGVNVNVHLKASAMHGLSSVLAGVEAMKGSNELNVAVLNDTYYESSGALSDAKTYKLSVLDGDAFNRDGNLETSFPDPHDKTVNSTPKKPIDLFVCEFHHNISLTRQNYSPERIAEQIKAMHQKGMLADKCTVAIDTTIGLEKSPDLQKLLADPVINSLIKHGKLNIVLIRSAQKFDMLGMDNYYGGITTSINKGKAFSNFNARMNAPEDQLRGLSYQGLAHMHTNCSRDIEAYRTGIMRNTQLLYNKLPKQCIYHEGTDNPMQISQINDNNIVFLDIKFPENQKAAEAFRKLFMNFAKDQKIMLTTRASFGFPNSNFTVIEGHKFRLNPGLDSENTLNQFAEFFQKVQECIAQTKAEAGKLPKEEFDTLLAQRLATIPTAPPPNQA